MLVRKSSQNVPKNKLCLKFARLLGLVEFVQLQIERDVRQSIIDQPL